MNSLINAATGVTEAAKAVVWGKPEDESGTEPPTADVGAAKGSSPPYDPGNSIDTAPTTPAAPPAQASVEASTEGTAGQETKAVELAIPAPGNDETTPAIPSEGATATPALGEKADTAATDSETAAVAPAVAPAMAASVPAEPVDTSKIDVDTKDVTAAEPAVAAAPVEAPQTPPKAAAAAPAVKARDDSPASTPGSAKKGIRSKLKEKLHIGSSKSSPQSGS